jgi:hypothetical protein
MRVQAFCVVSFLVLTGCNLATSPQNQKAEAGALAPAPKSQPSQSVEPAAPVREKATIDVAPPQGALPTSPSADETGPDFIPRYPGGEYMRTITHQVGQATADAVLGETRIAFTSSDDPQKIIDFYAEAFVHAGYSGMGAKGALAFNKNDGSGDTIMLNTMKSEALGTLVTITTKSGAPKMPE